MTVSEDLKAGSSHLILKFGDGTLFTLKLGTDGSGVLHYSCCRETFIFSLYFSLESNTEQNSLLKLRK